MAHKYAYGSGLDTICQKHRDHLTTHGIDVNTLVFKRQELEGSPGFDDVPIAPNERAEGHVKLIFLGRFSQNTVQQKSESVKQPKSKLARCFEQTKKLLDKEPPSSTEAFIHVIVSQAMEILMKRQYGYTPNVGKFYQALKKDANFRDILQDLLAKDGNLLNKGAIVKMAIYSWRERVYKATNVNGLTNFQRLLSDGIELLESMGQLEFYMQYRLNFLKAVPYNIQGSRSMQPIWLR
ncbi:g3612 [Coccomyxa elongata]